MQKTQKQCRNWKRHGSIRSVVLGIHHLESGLYYELFYYTQSYAPLLSLFQWVIHFWRIE